MTKEQLGELILDSSDSMYHVAKTLLRNDADCSDAISETIVKAFAKLHTLQNDRYGKTWLIRILINECYMTMRREKRIVSIEDYPPEEKTAEREDYSDLYQAIIRLPQDIRICVTLYYMEGYSVKEIAALLEVTESTVKNRLARARRRLRNDLEPEVAKG
ncbi:MAG: sigma-70 family RNA polymerase sigma factor [Lachnospiraceae bacterium]|nr:sigma-70 family RNA polymerase sigma factor [Lachnospiraceae bacterium]